MEWLTRGYDSKMRRYSDYSRVESNSTKRATSISMMRKKDRE
jgi:hypothetical protein